MTDCSYNYGRIIIIIIIISNELD